jgi:peptidoglycan hydrolase-like protein with peptidoglycan-binding domain
VQSQRFIGPLLAVIVLAPAQAFASAGSTQTTQAGSSSPPSSGTPPAPAQPTSAPPTRLTELPSSTVTNGTAPLRVRLSGAPAANSPLPDLTPNVSGKWTIEGDVMSFRPTSTLEPCSTYTLTLWARTDVTGAPPLGQARKLPLNVACPSLRGLQQALARLRYLPFDIDAAHGRNSGGKPEAPGIAYGQLDPTTRGALMVFQDNHNLVASGEPNSATWASLLAAETLGRSDPQPYTFVTVSESSPETLRVHRGRNVAITTAANTGVSGAETQLGTFPIYARYTSTTMTGTNPDGTKYSDPGVPWVNYFNGGDAVHGFPRASYGFPQSNGCVELPIETAAQVYPLLAIGDLVIVSG